MAANPLVSAIIPTYNNAALAPDAVNSVLHQTYAPIECIIVDDGSTDDTLRRLEEFGSKITIVRQEHQGPAVARNAGIQASSGEFAAFLDSDDLWLPEKIEKCIAAFQGQPNVGVVYTALRIHELDTGRQYVLPQYTQSGQMARDLFLECKGVNTSTLVVRRRCLDAVTGFDEDFFRAQDWDLMVRLAEDYEYVHVPDVLTERRLHQKCLSVTHRDLYAKYNMLVIEKALARRPDLYADLKGDALARAHFRFGMEHYRGFQMTDARRELKTSLTHKWNIQAFNYLMRTYLPTALVRVLRGARLHGKPRETMPENSGEQPNE